MTQPSEPSAEPSKLPDRKPAGMSWTSFADAKIREAQASGQFDNLPGFGKPLPGIGEPDDENWWVKDRLQREGISLLPPALAIKLDVERTLATIAGLTNIEEVRQTLAALNTRIRQAHWASITGPPCDTQELSEAAVLEQWQAQRGPKAAD